MVRQEVALAAIEGGSFDPEDVQGPVGLAGPAVIRGAEQHRQQVAAAEPAAAELPEFLGVEGPGGAASLAGVAGVAREAAEAVPIQLEDVVVGLRVTVVVRVPGTVGLPLAFVCPGSAHAGKIVPRGLIRSKG